ncbi:hypothetical protein KC318_g6260 [Hortaea werneckii]|nr:hypothetical protein KC334_g2585 [Hortaea werneckii]KAI7025014.1 hypothetical protein KC355_g1219 [Hortaea werneckii]KAI7666838.1 hypothetical protein KC318_g6260 [Hortaea werneckii]
MMNISSSASNEHATTQASHALDSFPVATDFQVASADCEHADGPSDDPIASHQLATGANDGNAAQAAAVNSVKCATQLDHSSAMSTTSGSETSDDSMNPRLDNLTPPESPGEADPLYTASTAYGRAPSQPMLPRAQHASPLEQKHTAKGRQSVHSPKSHLRNASTKFVERQPSPSHVTKAQQRRRREDKQQYRVKRLAEEMQLVTVSPSSRTRQEGQGRLENPSNSPLKSKRSTAQSPQHVQLTRERPIAREPCSRASPVSSSSPPKAEKKRPSKDRQSSGLLPQPEALPISQDQLAAEVKGIYAGLIMVESKCINIDAAQASECPTKLAREQWQALVALHRTLLYEHYDFLMATQHPLATDELKALPARYCMPARMWKHAIHSFLEVLRHRRPDSHEYMLAFVYLTYQMMALLLETVPSFEDTWVECLGDLARYRMAIEEDRDLYSHWAGVASSWYIKATDKHPEAGRLYHHLGILERPSLQKFACYGKSQTCVIPFPNTKDSMTLLCTPLAEDGNAARTATRSTEASLCRMFALIYLQKPTEAVDAAQKSALELLERPGGFRWRDNGVALALSSTSALLELASLANPLRVAYDSAIQQHLRSTGPANATGFTSSNGQHDSQNPREPAQPADQPLPTNARDITFAVLNSALGHGVVDDILPCVHVMLLFLNSLILIKEHHNQHHTVGKLLELEGVSWGPLSLFLNTLVHLVGGVPQEVMSCALRGSFSPAEKSLGRFLLPEDFTMRGLVWSYFAYESGMFDDCGDPHERFVESSRTVEARRERVLYYGLRLAFESSYITFDPTTSTFKASGANTSYGPTSRPAVPWNTGAKHTSVVGQPGMPSPAARPKGPKLKFSAEDDALLLELRETKNLTWRQIADFFPGRASGLPQVRYGNLLKAKPTTSTSTSTSTSTDADVVCRPHSSRKQRDAGVGDRSVQIADPDAMNWEGGS